MKKLSTLIAALSALLLLGTGCSREASVSSPDGSLTLQVALRDGRIGYAVSRNGKPILDFSAENLQHGPRDVR